MQKAAILHKIYFAEKGEIEFVAWICEAAYQALNHVSYVKNHIDYNKSFLRYFGVLSGEATGRTWTKKDFVTAKGDRLVAMGTGQRLRGIIEGDTRLTGAVLDDVEGEENTKTPERRRFNREWVSGVVFPAMEKTLNKEGWIWLSGTIVHFDSYLASIYEAWRKSIEDGRSFSWDVHYFEATEPIGSRLEGKPLWPDRFSTAVLKKEHQRYLDDGTPQIFWREYFNDPRDVESLPFNPDNVQYYSGHFASKGGFAYLHIGREYIPINVYIGVDLAATATSYSDRQAIVVLGIDAESKRYIIDKFYERIPIYDMPATIIEYANKYSPIRGGAIETVQAQEMVRDAVARLSAKEKKLVPWMWGGVKPPPGIKKEDRLLGALGGFVHNKKLFISRDQAEILDEMLDFPAGKRDDLLDALYYADYYAKHNAPHSNVLDEEQFGELEDEDKPKSRRKHYDWYTGNFHYVDEWGRG